MYLSFCLEHWPCILNINLYVLYVILWLRVLWENLRPWQIINKVIVWELCHCHLLQGHILVSYSRVMYPISPGNNRPALFLSEYLSSFVWRVHRHIFYNSINPMNIKSSTNELWFAANLWCMYGTVVRILPVEAAGGRSPANVTLTLPPPSSVRW